MPFEPAASPFGGPRRGVVAVALSSHARVLAAGLLLTSLIVAAAALATWSASPADRDCGPHLVNGPCQMGEVGEFLFAVLIGVFSFGASVAAVGTWLSYAALTSALWLAGDRSAAHTVQIHRTALLAYGAAATCTVSLTAVYVWLRA